MLFFVVSTTTSTGMTVAQNTWLQLYVLLGTKGHQKRRYSVICQVL